MTTYDVAVNRCTCGGRMIWLGRWDGRNVRVYHCPTCHAKFLGGYPCECGTIRGSLGDAGKRYQPLKFW